MAPFHGVKQNNNFKNLNGKGNESGNVIPHIILFEVIIILLFKNKIK